jgi:protein disulfide-isomerase-like protein
MKAVFSLFVLVALFSFVEIVRSENVLVLTPDNFDSYVGGSKPAFVEFYAPWCGHCKSLAPEYEIVGKSFEKVKNFVSIAKVDCDANKDLCAKYDVKGYPTLKWFPANGAEAEAYNGGRTAEDIVKFVNEKTELSVVVNKPAPLPTKVVVLTAENFDSIVLDTTKDVLVEFYAPWCGHCKRLAPDWDKLSGVFANEEDVVIAKVDCTVEESLKDKYDVKGFPTLKFFSKENKAGEKYEGGRSLNDLVSFINERSFKSRLPDGLLTGTAGRDSSFDKLTASLFSSDDQEAVAEAARSLGQTSVAKTAQLYVKLIEKVVKSGKAYVESEIARLGRLLEGSVTPVKRDEFTIRSNILRSFLETPAEEEVKKTDEEQS